jgi:beta-glucosidase
MSGRAMYDRVDRVDPAKQAELKAEALEKAKTADVIIFVGGLNKNHRQDCENGDRESYDLSFGQNELIAELAKIQKNIIVVTFGGNPYAMPWLNDVRAVMHCWYLGSEAGNALVNVLFGKVNPSGKLPVTFAQKYEDYPYVQYGAEAYPGVNKQVTYKEDIFVGYRGFERNKVKALFPFGYGLSYTSFKYGKPTVCVNGEDIIVEATITNTGSVAGKEVAQVYVTAPKNKQMVKPAKELKTFGKTRLLQPGESETLRMTIKKCDLASWSEALHDWQLDAGTYTILVGASSADIREKASIKI